MELLNAINVAASGMKAQSTRLRVVSENLANADTMIGADGVNPYRRRLVNFKNELDRASGARLVRVGEVALDRSDYKMEYNPTHPSADPDGYVRMPNVNSLVEIMDMREAQRSYDANVTMIENSRSMLQRTVDLLRA
ncbi:MAG: flagellar basal body rod protein FlgC [Proteobacteria bacterium]|nr:flagellar basal body rod protein FlgC [Pseudomonadota bacterium]MBI3497224.1 flagellar basal body rod protein FlgC [Pseudomonadota bacterium]